MRIKITNHNNYISDDDIYNDYNDDDDNDNDNSGNGDGDNIGG